MGMDVIGVEPTSQTGEYFRNNVWWWRPLWDYCCEVSDEARSVEYGQSNDGDGLDSDGAIALGKILLEEIESGATKEYEQYYYKSLSELPMQECSLCNSTGIRTDEIGIQYGMPDKELSPEQQIVLGRTHGLCNGCDGVGQKPNFSTNYPFSVENVQEFANFLLECGGFSIC